MPLYEREGKKIYFVHVPKCGGSSVRKLLELNGWNRILEPSNFPLGGAHQLYKTWKNWKEVENSSFIFTVVRHPYSRVISHINMWLDHMIGEDIAKVMKMLEGELPVDKDFFLDHFEDMGFGVSDRNNNIHSVREIPFEFVMELIQRLPLPKHLNKEAAVSYIINSFSRRYNRDILGLSQEELISIYMKETEEYLGAGGVNPTPSRFYISPDTKTYKFENREELFKDLRDKNIISADYSFPHLNALKWKFIEPINPIPGGVKKLLMPRYELDFKKFGYSLED